MCLSNKELKCSASIPLLRRARGASGYQLAPRTVLLFFCVIKFLFGFGALAIVAHGDGRELLVLWRQRGTLGSSLTLARRSLNVILVLQTAATSCDCKDIYLHYAHRRPYYILRSSIYYLSNLSPPASNIPSLLPTAVLHFIRNKFNIIMNLKNY